MKRKLSFLGKKNFKAVVVLTSVFVLAITFLIRLFDQAKLLKHFPGGSINDLSSYLAQLYFLDACGFHSFCSYWYNGFTAFLITPPGWFFFAYPFYQLFGDVKIAAYLSTIVVLVLAFLVIYLFGKKFHIKPQYRVLFFLLLFANANVLRGLIRLGRPHELLSWLLFLLLFFIILSYKDKQIDWKFYVTAFLYAAILITYFSVAVFGSLLFLGIFLVKPWRERMHIILAILLAFLLSSFWLVPFLLNVKGTLLFASAQNVWLLTWDKYVLFKQLGALLFPLAFFIIFYAYWKQRTNKKTLLFYFPFLLLTFLFFFRVTAFLPVFKDISPNPYFTLFILLSGFLFVSLKDKQTFLHRFITLSIGIAVIASSVLVLFFTPYFAIDNKDTQDFLELMPAMEGRYILLGMAPKEVYSKATSAYAAIYYDLTYASGFYLHVTTQAYFDELNKLHKAFRDEDCAVFKEQMVFLNTTEAVSHTGCGFLQQCGMTLQMKKNDYCLYSY